MKGWFTAYVNAFNPPVPATMVHPLHFLPRLPMKFVQITIATLSMALPAEAIAGDCAIVYDNKVELLVKDDSAALVGGAAFGLLGSLVASATNKPNNNDLEITIKGNIEKVDTFQYFNNVRESLKISAPLDKPQTAKCSLSVKLIKHEVAYSAASAILMMKFHVSKFEDGLLLVEKDMTLRRTAISPIPKTPKPKYKQEGYGKWVNIAPPTPTQEEALAAFDTSYKIELNLLYKELIDKKLKNY